MKLNKIKYTVLACAALAVGATSCVGDLDITPKDPSKRTDLTNGLEYYNYFAQIYAGLTIAGVNNNSDISVDDGGAGVEPPGTLYRRGFHR